ncbi:MAG: hypothetical protein C0615_06630 [Desulfuromonas sp.]|nr:MAG: hypothetical protein C0615_06630 [Desulfuromonas sp.]
MDWQQIIYRQRDVLPQIQIRESNAGEISERRDGGCRFEKRSACLVYSRGHHTDFFLKNNNFLEFSRTKLEILEKINMG